MWLKAMKGTWCGWYREVGPVVSNRKGVTCPFNDDPYSFRADSCYYRKWDPELVNVLSHPDIWVLM